ncbi:KRAB-A domain-containing protein 2-like protein [Aphelenchoides bicaudatus]|nr:KRAB-A domain-containing protein 2-like protein [Aphelenchoides bicaudatus]
MDAQAKFMSKLTALYSKKPNNTYLITKQGKYCSLHTFILFVCLDYYQRIQRLSELSDIQIQRTSADVKLLKNCALLKDSTNQLKLCKPGTTLVYVAMEDLFDTLHGIHLQLNHAGRNCMQRHIRTNYCNISKDCVMLYLGTCLNCPRNRRMNGVTKKSALGLAQSNNEQESDEEVDIADVKKDPNSTGSVNVLSATPLTFTNQKLKHETVNFNRGQIDLFEMTQRPDDGYSWFMRFTNCTTRQIYLRPIKTGTIPEIANKLLDIYCDQGAPVVLQSLNGRVFVQQIIVETNKLFPQCRQLHSDMQDNGNESNIILSQLCDLMERYNSAIMVQLIKSPSMGLRSSKLIDILYERSNSIDDFYEFLTDAELMRMSMFCAENKQTPIVRQCDEFASFNNNYSPIATTSTMSSQIVCTPESLPHSSTSSNNSFYTQPAPNTPTLTQGNTYHSLTNAQPETPTQQQQNNHFPVNTFEQSPATHSPNAYFPSVSSAQIANNNEAMQTVIKNDEDMLTSHQMEELQQQMNC